MNVRTRRATALATLGLALAALGAGAATGSAQPSPVASAPETSLDYAARGPHGVGYLRLADGTGRRRMDIHVWYPGVIPAGAVERVRYDVPNKDRDWKPAHPLYAFGRALAGAAPVADEAPYPVIVFSHGFHLSPVVYAAMTEHYASRGFVVVAPEHRETLDTTFQGLWKGLIDRPRSVTRTLDAAERLTAPGGALEGLLDMSRVAVVGHSYGGYTALAAAGARYDMHAYRSRCGALPKRSPLTFFCSPILPNEGRMAARAGLARPPRGLWPSAGDPRVRAIIPMAGDAYMFGRAGLAKVTVPTMAIGGTADTGTPYGWGARLTYDGIASSTKILVTLKGAEHFVFTSPCKDQPWVRTRWFRSYLCADPAWNKARALRVVLHLSTAFLQDTLKGDTAARARLAPSAVAIPGVRYAATSREDVHGARDEMR